MDRLTFSRSDWQRDTVFLNQHGSWQKKMKLRFDKKKRKDTKKRNVTGGCLSPRLTKTFTQYDRVGKKGSAQKYAKTKKNKILHNCWESKRYVTMAESCRNENRAAHTQLSHIQQVGMQG